MKRLLFYIIAIALFTTSCETGSNFNSYGFEGKYQMRTEVYSTNPDGEIVKAPRDMISTVPIYVENGHLYLRTIAFGMPNMGTYDAGSTEYTVDPPYENHAPAVDGDNEDGDNEEGSGIEVIDVNPKAIIILRNGYVWVIKSGSYLQSLPIKALNVKEYRILFKNSDTFDVEVTDASGMQLGTWRNHFEYSPAILKNDTIHWDVKLCVDPGVNTSGFEYDHNIIYRNTLVRK